jgi:hypothetical protein
MDSLFGSETESLQTSSQEFLAGLGHLNGDQPEAGRRLELLLKEAREANLRIRSVLFPNCQFEPQGQVPGEDMHPVESPRNLMWKELVESSIAALGELGHSISQIDEGKAERGWMEAGGKVRKLRDFVPELVRGIIKECEKIKTLIHK